MVNLSVLMAKCCDNIPLHLHGEESAPAVSTQFQFLHQSTYKVPIDFIMTLESPESHSELHRNQVANCIAQSEALMVGNKQY